MDRRTELISGVMLVLSVAALLLGTATLSQAGQIDPYGYKLPPSMQPKKKAAVPKPKGPPPRRC